MKTLKIFLVFGIVLLASCKELAQQPGSAVRIAPSAYNGSLGPVIGDGGVQADWHIAQWGIPLDLPTNTIYIGQDWQVANNYARVKYVRSSNAYELGQNGELPDLACGLEFDLFLEPNTAGTYSGYPVAFNASMRLDQLQNIIAFLNLDIVYENIINRCPLPTSQWNSFCLIEQPIGGSTTDVVCQ